MNIFVVGPPDRDRDVISALIQSKLGIKLISLKDKNLSESFQEILRHKREDVVFFDTPIDLYLESLSANKVYAPLQEIRKLEKFFSGNSIVCFCLDMNPYNNKDYLESPSFQKNYELYLMYYELTKFRNKFTFDKRRQRDEVLAELLAEGTRRVKAPSLIAQPKDEDDDQD